MKIKSLTYMVVVFIVVDTCQNVNKIKKKSSLDCFDKSINMTLLRINLDIFFHLPGRKDFIYT